MDPDEVEDIVKNYMTIDQVCRVLKLRPKTLKARIATGTDHPPYVEIRRGVLLFHKRLFLDWIAKKPIIWEVKSAS